MYYLDQARSWRDRDMAAARRLRALAQRANIEPERRQSYERQVRQRVGTARLFNRLVVQCHEMLRYERGQAA